MEHIATIELSTATANFTFSNISQDYDDLVIVAHLRANDQTSGERKSFQLQLNGTSNDRSAVYIRGTQDGSAPSSSTGTGDFMGRMNSAGSTSNSFSSVYLYFPGYSSATDKRFSSNVILHNNDSIGSVHIQSNFWKNTSAITSITLDTDDINFAPNTMASLYGITKGSDGITTVS